MDRRQIVALVLMTGIFLVWLNVAPRLFPEMFAVPDPVAEAPEDPGADDPAVGSVDADNADDSDDSGEPAGAAVEQEPAEPERDELRKFEPTSVVLGDPKKGYLQRLKINSRGAVIEWPELTQPRSPRLDTTGPFRLLGDNTRTTLKSLEVRSGIVDSQLSKIDPSLSLATVDWQFDDQASQKIEGSDAYSVVTYRYPSPDGDWEVVKRYAVHPGEDVDPETDPEGYLIDFDLTFRNLSDKSTRVSYLMQGPVGVPLENADNTRMYREVEAGTLQDPSDPTDIEHVMLTASSVVSDIEEAEADNDPGARPVWRYPVKWAGIDIQYFTTLLIPLGDQLKDLDGDGKPDPYFEEILPTIVSKTEEEEQSDISLLLKSGEFSVPAASGETPGELKHSFQLYAGPKRADLLAKFGAEDTINFGWFGIISKGMLWLLGFFHHSLMLPYGIAIILLTVVVRGCMFPLSKKQVAGVQKMKEINPKIQALKEKYKDDKEALTRAQLDLMKKHGYNPLAGCLPIFFQLPIFIGLYNALNTSIDLRLAPFLWIDNLGAPDALFDFPNGFEVPILGWTQFNVLPLITVVLFVIQNKLFTPPPTNEEQALQQKMMNVMMAVIGIMFYRVPAGLCVYFIASSLWGICERKLLDRHKRALEAARTDDDDPDSTEHGGRGGGGPKQPKNEPEPPKEPGFLARLMEAADQAKNQTPTGKARGKKDEERTRSGKKKRRSKNRR